MNHWINSPEQLKARFTAWSEQNIVAVDTEFVREKTYYPQLALVQLGIDNEILLIDPLIPGMDQVLKNWLLDTRICKIFHCPSEDLQALLRGTGAVPVTIFDTQLAAALCGMGGGLSYLKLVAAVTGVTLEKGETRSDWLQRPLTESQCHYAADDVKYLHTIHAHLIAQLQTLNRMEWLNSDMQRAIDLANQDSDERYPHIQLSRAQGLDQASQALLCRLLRWRDSKARQSDRPKSWILDNELAAYLARAVPRDIDSFTAVLNRSPKSPRRFRDELWHEVARELTAEEKDIPPIKPFESSDKQRLKQLQDVVAKRATELNIPEGLLASRKHLEPLLEGRWPDGLDGWRREQLESDIAPLMRG
jgi:ribonuclease D